MPFPPERRKSDTNDTEKVPVTGVLLYFLCAVVDIVSFQTCFMPTWETFKNQLLYQWLLFGTPVFCVPYLGLPPFHPSILISYIVVGEAEKETI